MEKFTKIINKPIEIIKDFTIFKGNKINILQNKETEWTKSTDKVFVLPYIVSENSFLLKNEPVTPYISKNKNTKQKSHYLTTIGGKMKQEESPQQTIKRKLYEDCGILLSDMYEIKIEGPFFYSKISEDQYYISTMILNPNDFRKTFIGIPQSDYDKDSMLLKINLNDINNILIPDLYSAYMLEKLKNLLNIK